VANRMTQSALLVAGVAAAGAAAVTLFELRRLTGGRGKGQQKALERIQPAPVGPAPVSLERFEPEHVEPESATLPIGRSADPEIDEALSRQQLPQDDTSGAVLLGEPKPASPPEVDLDDIWQSEPNIAEDSQSEGYDAVTPEDLGSVWLERATQTTHDAHVRSDDMPDLVALDTAGLSESSLSSSHLRDYDEEINDDDLDADSEVDIEEALADEEPLDEDEPLGDDEADEDALEDEEREGK